MSPRKWPTRLKDLRTGGQTQTLHRLPHRLDDRRRSKVRIRGRGARGCVFLFRQQVPQLAADLLPFLRWIGTEGVGQRSPSAVPREQSLLRLCRLPALGFDLFEDANSRDVVARLFLQPAFADPVRLCYAEVPRRDRRGRLRLDFPIERGRGRTSLGRNAHFLVASSQAAW